MTKRHDSWTQASSFLSTHHFEHSGSTLLICLVNACELFDLYSAIISLSQKILLVANAIFVHPPCHGSERRWAKCIDCVPFHRFSFLYNGKTSLLDQVIRCLKSNRHLKCSRKVCALVTPGSSQVTECHVIFTVVETRLLSTCDLTVNTQSKIRENWRWTRGLNSNSSTRVTFSSRFSCANSASASYSHPLPI